MFPKVKFTKQKQNFDGLSDVDSSALIPGDVLILRQFAMDGVVRGQAIFSHNRQGGHCTARHAIIATANGNVVHAVGASAVQARTAGIYSEYASNLDGSYVVFRPTNTALGAEAATVAERLAGGNNGFGSWKSVFSVFRRQSIGRYADQYLADLQTKVYGQGAMQSPKMFCSELVAACYEVAALQLSRNALGVDPRAMSVKALEAAIKHSGRFVVQGKMEQS
jgi:hypothetical protein